MCLTWIQTKLNLTSISWDMRLIWLENAYSHPLFRQMILSRKAGQTDLVFGVQSRFTSRFVRVCLQDNKSLCAAVTTWTTQTDTQMAFWPAYMNSPAKCTNKTKAWFKCLLCPPVRKWIRPILQFPDGAFIQSSCVQKLLTGND